MKEVILIPAIEFPVHHWANEVKDVEVYLTLKECKTHLKSLGAGTHAWAEPDNYNSAKTVLAFLNRNLALAQELRLRALGLY